MLLAIDIGNSHTVVGLFEGEALRQRWRLSTSVSRTGDETALLLGGLLRLAGSVEPPVVEDAVVVTVVPAALDAVVAALRALGVLQPCVVATGADGGMAILCDNPAGVGADRIVNAVAAYALVGAGVIVVDFGTATTFDVVTPQGAFLGGAIAPGLGISADALVARTAKLPRVEVARPEHAVGRCTREAMQAGLYYGYSGLVDGIIGRMRAELDYPVRVLATGGLAHVMEAAAVTIDAVDEGLTLRGLRMIHAIKR